MNEREGGRERGSKQEREREREKARGGRRERKHKKKEGREREEEEVDKLRDKAEARKNFDYFLVCHGCKSHDSHVILTHHKLLF